ncbi:hypothetical protein [Jatrophihabitans lederbergiae]|jgi:hypothetical protein|uniref:DUF1127 domain-containing protein n=1 Tax=Jatrophihabitans lederbergiae TaxID=3075547 RepID=A0ABU2JER1_9ACTN|nr:hypothetical protein [Jatrophihabitans sp. DSM 44399]MDT0263492.1 hypothetical protein [Jatrophihabitans sp. DSM 44399]
MLALLRPGPALVNRLGLDQRRRRIVTGAWLDDMTDAELINLTREELGLTRLGWTLIA